MYLIIDGKQVRIDSDQVEIGRRICRLVDNGEINLTQIDDVSKRMKRILTMRALMVIGLQEAVYIEQDYHCEA
jgi:hypothetical protein